MSANLIDERRPSNAKRFRVSQPLADRYERPESIRRYSIPPATDDEESKRVARAAICLIVLGITPLILFYIITIFYPDIFMISATPN